MWYGPPELDLTVIASPHRFGWLESNCGIQKDFLLEHLIWRPRRSQGEHPRFGARPDLPIPEAKVRLGILRNARSILQTEISEVHQRVCICPWGTMGKLDGSPAGVLDYMLPPHGVLCCLRRVVHYLQDQVTDWNLLFPKEFTGQVYNSNMSNSQEPIGKCAHCGLWALRFKVYRASAPLMLCASCFYSHTDTRPVEDRHLHSRSCRNQAKTTGRN